MQVFRRQRRSTSDKASVFVHGKLIGSWDRIATPLVLRKRRFSEKAKVAQVFFKISIGKQRYQLFPCSFPPQLQRFFNFLFLLGGGWIDAVQQIKMHLAVTQLTRGFA